MRVVNFVADWVVISDIRFQSFEDGDLADIWYASAARRLRHPDHFQKLMDECFRSSSNGAVRD